MISLTAALRCLSPGNITGLTGFGRKCSVCHGGAGPEWGLVGLNCCQSRKLTNQPNRAGVGCVGFHISSFLSLEAEPGHGFHRG